MARPRAVRPMLVMRTLDRLLEAGATRREVADRCGVHVTTVQRYVQAAQEPPTELTVDLMKLAVDALRVVYPKKKVIGSLLISRYLHKPRSTVGFFMKRMTVEIRGRYRTPRGPSPATVYDLSEEQWAELSQSARAQGWG